MYGTDCHLYLVFQGKIACANVLSDLYAMGVTDCDNMLMTLGVSQKFKDKERDKVIPLIMRGFKVSSLQAILVCFLAVNLFSCWKAKLSADSLM